MAMDKWAAWVGGAPYTGAGEYFTVDEPATGHVLAEVSKLGPEDVDRAVRTARTQFESGVWQNQSATQRGKVLLRMAQLIRDEVETLSQLEARQVGKPIRDARDEVLTAADCFEFYAGAANKLHGDTIPVSQPGLDYTIRVPVGVVGLIVPWNFPFLITAWKVAPALAVGNSVVVKPASYAPLTALKLGPIAQAAGVPDGVLNIVTGPGGQTGEALASHHDVDKIAFTGETTTGSRILALAAARVARVSLELGGKSPTIVFPDVDVDMVARLAVASAYANGGQDCCARSRLLVHRDIAEAFTERFQGYVRQLKIGDPLDPTVDMGPLVSLAHRDRVRRYVESGVQEGARLVLAPEAYSVPTHGFYQAPAVFSEVSESMTIVQEEIFGPVSTIQVFDTEEEAIAKANATPYGLSGSVFSRDIGRALRVAHRVKSGVLSVNSIKSVHLEAPFGGFKMSGIGRELGLEALELYTEVKNIFVALD
ncbi:MAG: aldehyde dehydrogenase family protein [Firmicutes bacterium]|nr:aldehyde dehydrogenase family protein [Bacillota bacterium]